MSTIEDTTMSTSLDEPERLIGNLVTWSHTDLIILMIMLCRHLEQATEADTRVTTVEGCIDSMFELPTGDASCVEDQSDKKRAVLSRFVTVLLSCTDACRAWIDLSKAASTTADHQGRAKIDVIKDLSALSLSDKVKIGAALSTTQARIMDMIGNALVPSNRADRGSAKDEALADAPDTLELGPLRYPNSLMEDLRNTLSRRRHRRTSSIQCLDQHGPPKWVFRKATVRRQRVRDEGKVQKP